MPVGFANPALLFGGLAAALPVIIHFLSRKKVRREKFSDMRFLTEVQARQARSLGVRRWILLLLRILALLALTAAVAGPRWGGLAVGAGSGRSLIFVIDTSASMGTRQDDGTRLEEALVRCGHMMDSLPSGSQVQVIAAGSRTLPVFGEWLSAGAGAVAGLTGVSLSDGAVDLEAVMREVTRLVVRAPSRPVDVVFISDFQENPLPRELTAAVEKLHGAGTTRWILHQVGQEAAGGGILDVILPQRGLRQGETGEITALVTSHLPDQAFVLEIDGRQVAEAVPAEPTDTPARLTFNFSVPAPGLHAGKVIGPHDAFAGDDQRPFVLAVPDRIPVLLVHGTDRAVDPPAGRGGWRYLAEALSPAGADGLFSVKAVASDYLKGGDLASATVAVFVDIDPLGRSAGAGLRAWLDEGGTALFLMGEPTSSRYLDGSLLPLLEMPPGAEILSRQSQHVRVVDAGHPIFAGLPPEALGTLEDVTWRRWFRLPGIQEGVLLEFADGSPAAVAGRLAKGGFVLMPFDLLATSTHLAASPMALPFFQRTVSWLVTGGLRGTARNLEVGERAIIIPAVESLQLGLDNPALLQVVDADGTGHQTAEWRWQGDTPRLVGPVLDRTGVLTFQSAGDTLGMVAAQMPPSESPTGLYSLADWTRLAGVHGLEIQGQLDSENATALADTLTGTDLAPLFFGLAFFLLLSELFVGRGAAVRKTA